MITSVNINNNEMITFKSVNAIINPNEDYIILKSKINFPVDKVLNPYLLSDDINTSLYINSGFAFISYSSAILL